MPDRVALLYVFAAGLALVAALGMAEKRLSARHSAGAKRLVVAGEDVSKNVAADSGQALRFFLSAANRRRDPIGQPAEGKGLQDDVTWTGQRGVEKPFAAEQRIPKAADELDVVGHAVSEANDAAGIDA